MTQLSLFRVAQEALANIIARGGAKNVEVVIEPEGDGYVMLIGDDGPAGHRSRAFHAERASPHAVGRRQRGRRSARRQGNQHQGFRPAICSSIGMS